MPRGQRQPLLYNTWSCRQVTLVAPVAQLEQKGSPTVQTKPGVSWSAPKICQGKQARCSQGCKVSGGALSAPRCPSSRRVGARLLAPALRHPAGCGSCHSKFPSQGGYGFQIVNHREVDPKADNKAGMSIRCCSDQSHVKCESSDFTRFAACAGVCRRHLPRVGAAS